MPATLHDALVTVWLGVCAVWDIRTRAVPNLLSLPGLVYGMVSVLLQGNWPAGLLAVGLVFLSDLSRPLASCLSILALGAAAAFTWLKLGLGLEALLTQAVIVIVWQLWLHGLNGGADAKILMGLVLLYGSGIFLAVTFAGGVIGLFALARKQKMLPYVLPIAVGSAAFFVLKHAGLL